MWQLVTLFKKKWREMCKTADSVLLVKSWRLETKRCDAINFNPSRVMQNEWSVECRCKFANLALYNSGRLFYVLNQIAELRRMNFKLQTQHKAFFYFKCDEVIHRVFFFCWFKKIVTLLHSCYKSFKIMSFLNEWKRWTLSLDTLITLLFQNILT